MALPFVHRLWLAVLSCLVACGSAYATPTLKPLWNMDSGLASPESVVFYPKQQVAFVSNVNGYSKNGKGYLSKISLQGKLLEQKFIAGLNGPTGMAILDNSLYVADIDELVKIDLSKQRVTWKMPAPDPSPGLNDVTIDQQGRVYVSGSFSRTIYRLEDNQLKPWHQGDHLRDANGILATESHLAFLGYHYFRLNLADQNHTGPLFKDTLFDLESVEADERGGLFITGIGTRPIWYLKEGQLTAILDRDTFSADVEYVPGRQLLLVPSGQDRVFAFKVEY